MMTPPDDLKQLPGDGGDKQALAPRRRMVGPESEVRGGAEAPEAALSDTAAERDV